MLYVLWHFGYPRIDIRNSITIFIRSLDILNLNGLLLHISEVLPVHCVALNHMQFTTNIDVNEICNTRLLYTPASSLKPNIETVI